MRRLLWLAVLGVLAWIFVVPSCTTEFGCEASGAVAQADGGECPDSADEAAGDARWAVARWESVKDRPRTVGLFYDEDGIEHRFVSGEKDFGRALEVLREVGAPISPIGTYPAASHVEVKAAVAMRDGDVGTGVIVINHPGGPCPGDLGCTNALPLVLPEGASLVVWWPTSQGMRSQRFAGRSG